MKLTTWNVNGVRAREAQVHEWLRRERPDVLCLQEIKAPPEKVPASICAPEGYWADWHGSGGYSGVALLISKALCPVRPRVLHPPFDLECRISVAVLGDVELASIYVPNGGKDFEAKLRFLEAMEGWSRARQAAGRQLVLCGDFNVAHTPRDVHEKLRNPEQVGQTPGERRLVDQLLATGLCDLGRKFSPDDDAYFTWWAPWRQSRERNIGWRLDWVLTTPALTARARECRVVREFGTSDHGPVTAVFDGPLFDAGQVEEGEAGTPEAREPQLTLL